MDLLTLLVFLLALCLSYYYYNKPPDSLPPGPQWIPFLGIFITIYKVMKHPEMFLRNMVKKYGDVVYMHGTPTNWAFFTRLDIMKKVFVQNAEFTSNRPKNGWLLKKVIGGNGIIFNPSTWKETRRFALTGMKDLGLGKDSLEMRIQDEAVALANRIGSQTDQAFNPLICLQSAVSNIICSINFGKRYAYNDPEYLAVLQNLNGFFEINMPGSPLNMVPALRHLGFAIKEFNVDAIQRPFDKIYEFVEHVIKEHKSSYDPDNIRDLVDLFIEAEKNGFREYPSLNVRQLVHTIVDLFLAGTETTATTLRWLLLYLINYPDVQRRCHKEILQNIGSEHVPDYSDRSRLPYTQAIIQETIRVATVAGGTLPHVADKSLEIEDYTIPKGTAIMGFCYGMHLDSRWWGEDAAEFRPDRWIDEQGQLKKIQEYMPFGLGRRACPGEQLAKQELFIFSVSLLQRFRFRAVNPVEPPPIKGVQRTVFMPVPFQIVAEPLNMDN